MSVDLESQLRSYRRNFDSEAPAVDPLGQTDQPVVTVETRPTARRAQRPRQGLAVAMVAALLVLIVIGGVGLIPGPVANEPDPGMTLPILWPQSSIDEVREAQQLADAGDPTYTWQLEPALEENLMSGDYSDNPEIFARFLREELGWERFVMHPGPGFGDRTVILVYVRCAPGKINSFYPDDPRGGGCAPTIDDFKYETVEVRVTQPVRQDSSGIWVVTQWETIEPIQQVMPPIDAEATAIVEAFLQARIDGEGAEQYLSGGDGTAPLLYDTTTEMPYERYEFDLVSGPEWPDDPMRFDVRLFAEDVETVVQQSFTVERDVDEGWGLDTGSETRENGQVIHNVFDGDVTFDVAPPWDAEAWLFNEPPNVTTLLLANDAYDMLRLVTDPRPIGTGCQEGPVPANAEVLAQAIMDDSDFEATEPRLTGVGGAPALRMDVGIAAGASVCDTKGIPLVITETGLDVEQGEPQRMGLYLVDHPDGSGRVLAIAIIAPETRFDAVEGAAQPVLDSIEFHTD
jgi:hypothetical protein